MKKGYSNDDITELTGLSSDEIEQLRKDTPSV